MNAKTATAESTNVCFVGCDDGHDSIKLTARRLGDKSPTIKLVMPSKVVRGARAVSLSGDNGAGGVYTAAGETYTVADALSGNDVIDTRTIGYPTHSINRILVQDALIRAGLGGQDVRLVTSLPVTDYYRNGTPNAELIDAKRANIISDDIKPMSSSNKPANIVDHRIACEAVSAIYDMAIKDDGSDDTDFFRLLDTAPIGVIDIGGKTIDLAVVYLDNGVPQIDMGRTSSIDYGMLRLQELIKRELATAHGVDELSPRMLFRVLSEKKLMLSGEDRDVSKEVQSAIAKIMPDMNDRLRASWGRAQDLFKIVVVGGGAHLLAGEIKQGLYQHAEQPKEPEYANARGMLKLGMRSFLQQAQA